MGAKFTCISTKANTSNLEEIDNAVLTAGRDYTVGECRVCRSCKTLYYDVGEFPYIGNQRCKCGELLPDSKNRLYPASNFLDSDVNRELEKQIKTALNVD